MTAAVDTAYLRKQALKGLNRLPPFSPVLNQLIAALCQENASLSLVAGIIERDPVLAGNLLRTSNSALYGRRERVQTVLHAASLLGMEKLRTFALDLSSFRTWNNVPVAAGWSMAQFNRHSVSVAILADQIAQSAHLPDAQRAFTAGLFHDTGKLLIATGLRAEYGEIERAIKETGRTRCECEREILGWDHAELAGEAVLAWKLPAVVQAAVQYHHDPDADPAAAEGGNPPLSRILWAADRYVNGEGEQGLMELLATLKLQEEWPRILAGFRKELAAIRDSF